MKAKILICLLLIVVLGAAGVYINREVLRVKAVIVQGCETRSPQEVTSLSFIRSGEHMLKVDLATVQANVQMSPYYEVEEVSRSYPDEIIIRVKERKPRVIVPYMDTNIIMDERGYVLEVTTVVPNDLDVPRVTGLRIGTFQVGQPLGALDTAQIRAMGSLVVALEKDGNLGQITAISLENPFSIYMKTEDGYTVSVGDTQGLDEKLHGLFNGVIPSLKESHRYGGVINLSLKGPSYKADAQAGGAGAQGLWSAETITPAQSVVQGEPEAQTQDEVQGEVQDEAQETGVQEDETAPATQTP